MPMMRLTTLPGGGPLLPGAGGPSMSEGRGCDCAAALSLRFGAPVLLSFGTLVVECPWCGAQDIDPEETELKTIAVAPACG
jgi:hypothetical protein